MPKVELADVSKAFPLSSGIPGASDKAVQTLALDQVSLTIAPGERVGVIGRNGAGKSTLLHLIAGVASPTGGTLSVEGHVTAVLTLGLGVREDLSGRENIYLDGEVQGRSRSEVDLVIDQVIDFADLGEFIDYPVRTYSTGMKSRLMFAMISHIDPEILLIDEALSAGDFAFADKATRRIREICERGKIVIVVSHGLDTLTKICNRCIWLDAGRIVMDGPANEVIAEYEKSIRDKDEAELLEKFRAHTGKHSSQVGFEVVDVRLRYEHESRSRALVETGADVLIEIDCDCPKHPPGADVRVTIERLDGLLLMDELMSQALAEGDLVGQARVTLRMAPLMIGYGTYKLIAQLIVHDQTTATCSTVFEVITPNSVRGGRPAIVCPHRVTTIAI